MPKILRVLDFETEEPVPIFMVDNKRPLITDREEAVQFLQNYGVKVTGADKILSYLLPTEADPYDYEGLYLPEEEYRSKGPQGIASANLMGLTSLHLLDNFFWKHPVFGMICSSVVRTHLRT